MQCPGCQHENRPQAKFCEACGIPLARLEPGAQPPLSYAEVQRSLTEALEQQTATAEVLRVISTSPTNLQPVLDTVVASAARYCGAYDATILHLDGGRLRLAAHHGPIPIPVGRTIPVVRGTASGRAVLERRAVHVTDIQAEAEEFPETRAFARELGYRTQLSVPLLREGAAIGTIGLRRIETNPFTEKQIALLETFADQAVIAIENVRLFTELQEKNRALTDAHAQVTEALEQQTATAEILRVISDSPTDLQPVINAVADSAARLCEATDAHVYQREGELLRVVASHGALPLARMEVPISRQSVLGRAVSDRRPIHVDDIAVAFSNEFPDAQRQKEMGYRTILATPLLREGEPIGGIVIRRTEVRPFTSGQVALLATFADQAVIAIENVRLFKELEARNRDLAEALEQQTATGEVLQAIAHTQTDAQPVFETIVQSAARLCRAAVAGIFLTDGRMVDQRAGYGGSSEARAANRGNYPRPVGMDSMPGAAILTRSIVHLPDSEEPSAVEFASLARQVGRVLGFRSVLAVPMLREGEPVGAITAARQEPGGFSDGEVALLKTFADQAVIAIENVRLFTELQEKNRALTQAHEQVSEALEQQTGTSDILRVLSGSPTNEQPVFDAIVRSARRLCDAAFSVVVLTESGQQTLAAVDGVDPARVEAMRAIYPRPLARETTTGRAILDRRIVHIEDSRLDPEYTHPLRDTMELRSILTVPIFREGGALGAVSVWRPEARPFTDKQIALLQTFADQAVIAIENVRLFNELDARTQELTRSVGELRALGEVGRAVSSTLELETVLTTIASRADELSGTDGAAIYEYNEPSEEFRLRVTLEMEDELVEALRAVPIRLGEGAVGRTGVTRQPVQISDIREEATYAGRLREAAERAGYRALLAVPFLREDQLVGALVVRRRVPGAFPQETIDILQTFASQSVLAIQNARLYVEIADKSQQLEAASQHKSEFLANMSHELRTPLNAVIGFSEVLLQRMFGELNEKQDEYLKDIYASGQHLLSLINDILDLSKVEAGRMELASAPFHLPTALENAVTLVKERAGRHGIALEVNIDPRLGEIVGDERKVKQVLLNLLSNAVKFTPEGGRISLKASRADGAVEIAVTDTGIGIAPEDQAAIFEEFRQVGHDETRKQEGTGLGLTLAKKFVELHGGRMWVESEVGAGSTFTFSIPLRHGE